MLGRVPCPEPDRWSELADPACRDELETHLDACADCRELVAALARTRTELAAPGARIGKYVVETPLGAGGMGIVLAALDPPLERTVALKLVRGVERSPAAVAAARARLVAEAKAMARVAHPNVVAVYEVVEEGDELFIAMERVDGADLATWLATAPRSRAERLRAVVDAGRGIAAAHAAGLVHRDIKPANILIGRDGRARITDLGLAAAIADGPLAGGPGLAAGSASRDGEVVRGRHDGDAVRGAGSPRDDDAVRGAGLPRGDGEVRGGGEVAAGSSRPAASRLVGTPGYLAPEVAAGARGDARSDQYAFAITAWQALFDERPGKADHGRLGRVLRRALAERPEDRYASVASLVDRLEHAVRARWPRYVVAGSTLVAIALGLAWWRERAQAAPAATCAADLTVGGVWTAPRRAALAMTVTARDRSPGQQLAPHVLELVDQRARAWGDAVADVCAARARGTTSPAVADRRGGCLEDQRRELDAVLGAIDGHIAGATGASQAAARVTAARALAAVAQLPSATVCAAPADAPAIPDDAPHRAAHAELTAIGALRAAGRYDEASARLEALAKVAPVDDAHLAATIAYRRADLAMRRGNSEAALPLVHDAVGIAERAHDDLARLRAMIVLVQVLDDLGRTTETKALVPLLEAAAARQTLDDGQLATLENTLGNVTHTAGDYVAAERHYRAAVAASQREYAGLPAPQIAGALEDLGTVLHNQAKLDEARETLARSVAMFEQTVGPDHPDIAGPLTELGSLALEAGELDRAASYYDRVIAVRTAALGADHPYLCEPLGMLGRVEHDRGHDDRALALYKRSLAIAEHGFGADHPLVAAAQLHIADLLEARGQRAEAKQLAEASVKIWDATGASLPEAHDARFLLAQLVWDDGAHARARTLAEAARAGYAAYAPPYNKTATTIAAWLAAHR
jgi:eukaryotic-like serine/threonine-protein kinase